ncbi:thiamine-phosphate kinase [Thiomicrorhabdus sediminis]|uniref:thiamine-phosphate kinase n=1 Tax=Thiomicrorhabdus sediminis TaxID=2580412 RepID=UPI00143DC16A|nr:thiamine-phosphate kinase [Thiomicrorhabdus sediminis]
MANEFQLIDDCFKPLSAGLSQDEIGIGDDGAVLDVPVGKQLVVVTDTLVKGVHFPGDAKAYDIAWKAVAVNLSDLAAMGAIPAFFSLALTLPDNDSDWLKEFSAGLKAIAEQYDIKLIGGDTTKGPLTITVTAQGWVDKQQAVLRSTAQPGDLVCVSNTIGDAAVGLKIALNTMSAEVLQALSAEQQSLLLKALHCPQPQVFIADLIKDYASSAIDISDGLLADLNHIIEQSSVKSAMPLQAVIEVADIPLSDALKNYVKASDDWSPVLYGGDDYQLCFTAQKDDFAEMDSVAELLGVKLTVIGEVGLAAESQQSKIQLKLNAKPFQVDKVGGYLHFS